MKNITLYFAALSVLIIISACSSNEQQGVENYGGERTVPAVEAVEARFGSLPLEERLSGVVAAANQIDMYPRISAPVLEVFVQDGDRVQQNDVLIKLDDSEYKEQLKQAEANLRITRAQQRQAEAELNEVESQMRRQLALNERDLTSELEMERVQALLESAEASYELARARVEQAQSSVDEQKQLLGRTEIRAPISGTVGQRSVEPGMLVNTGTMLFTIGDLTRSKVTINLTERMMQYINRGQSVRIFSETLGDTVITASVSRISPFLGAGSFSTTAEIDIRNENMALMPGMFVNVDVLYGESEQATVIPLSSIYRNPNTGESGVYVATGFGIESEFLENSENELANLSNPVDTEFRPINVIARGRETAGVEGINPGEWVVTVGQNLLARDARDTARIRPVGWNKIIAMQRMQPEDLLKEIMNSGVAQNSVNNL
ncbi:efflux RND transporter periplasmic adaptor subunit [Rhodohalobacter mucosus]|uniref:Efflux RND transporter periplasmic adaptor subunit n=1 Tax=Rhodohalobacter mucosus TaxID=2079485 RepID=A0A316TQE8_9BACT|nr:efflux RND transporter periplasmic adaptor subunit [Rhodohalobacter mucosus]PWN05901.1 efflux RND transporter periplasmic adaptor subunit [Rhodohalobacter mucosus]